MNCMEARRMVTPFVKKELSDKDTEAFLNHIGRCSDCMDELDIYYTAYHVLNLLDTGTHREYDFRKMLEEDIRTAKRNLLRKRVIFWLRIVGYLAAELLLLLTVTAGMRIRAGEDGLLRNMLQKAQLIWEEPWTMTQGETETEAQSGASAKSQNETETGTQNGASAETRSGASAKSQNETETETQSGAPAEAQSGAGKETQGEEQSKAEPETQTKAQSKGETGAEKKG